MSIRRLPRNESVIPRHYDVHLTTDLNSGQFCGSVKIDFLIEHEDQKSIKLDTSNLQIDLSSISVQLLSTLKTIRCTAELHQRSDSLEICLNETERFSSQILYRLIINSFSGHLTTEQQIGFYRSTVDVVSSNPSDISLMKKHYGLTQMSPTHCRRVFPCFDEPSLRATFDLTLDIPRHMHALSNMPPISIEKNFLNSGTKRIRFERTPSMPTFLLCFAIGEFDIVRSEPVERLKNDSGLSPIELTAFTLPGRKHEAKFALDCARRALHYYADLFQMEYPMKKLDLVAVPDLFYPAMENWALILFKEEEMLINEDHSVSIQYRNVCQSVTHEIAHQWFGNLVSIHWWTDVYVVEGFAKWFEYLATDYIVPEYNVFAEFFSTQFLRYFDYCINILHNEANDLDEKDFSFEGFIYSKGSCLMRMLHSFLGHEQFLHGIRLFLRRYAYRTATANDFWSCLEEITQLPILNLVHSWCTKKSYPVVHVQMVGYDESTSRYELQVKQMSFCDGAAHEKLICCHCSQTSSPEKKNSNGNHSSSNDDNWIIPLTILHGRSNGCLSKHLMRKKEEKIQISSDFHFHSDEENDHHERRENEPARKRLRSLSSPSNWFKLNICSSGPYRVLYSSNLMEHLIEAIRRDELTTFDRFNLENDLYALAMGGFTSLVEYFRLLLNGFSEELDDELVWKDIESNLIRIGTLLEYDPELYQYYRSFLIHFHRNLFQRLGFTAKANESIARGRLRCFLLVILGTIGNDPMVINYAREQLQIYLTDSSITVLWPICAIVAHHASDLDFNHLLQLWEQRTRRDDRLRCAYGLSYVQDASHIERILDFFANNSSNNASSSLSSSSTTTTHSLRLNERIECYKGFCLSKQGRFFYQRYIENNWCALRTNYTDEYLEALIRETFGYFASEDEAKRIEDFFLSYETFHQKSRLIKETPSTPCTRIAVHLSLDDQELSSLARTTLPSPILHHRAMVPNKVKENASIIAHTTRTRAALLERDRENLLKFFQSESFAHISMQMNSSSLIIPIHSQVKSNVISNSSSSSTSSPMSTGHKRKRRLSSLTSTSSSSPPVRNLLASDATV